MNFSIIYGTNLINFVTTSKNPTSNLDQKKSIKSQCDHDLSPNFSLGLFNPLSLLDTDLLDSIWRRIESKNLHQVDLKTCFINSRSDSTRPDWKLRQLIAKSNLVKIWKSWKKKNHFWVFHLLPRTALPSRDWATRPDWLNVARGKWRLILMRTPLFWWDLKSTLQNYRKNAGLGILLSFQKVIN